MNISPQTNISPWCIVNLKSQPELAGAKVDLRPPDLELWRELVLSGRFCLVFLPLLGNFFVSFCCLHHLCLSSGWGQQLGHVPAPCKDVQGSFQGRPQHHGGTNRHKNKTKTKPGFKRLEEKQNLTHRPSKFVHPCPILGDVRDVQVQQGADGDQQQESL